MRVANRVHTPPEAIQIIRESVALKFISGERYKRIEYGLKIRAVAQFVETNVGRTDHGVSSTKCVED